MQDMVDGYVETIETALAAFVDPATPAPARRALGGALNYVLDLLDIFPDHYKGIGVVDDAMLLRLAARQAVAAGAKAEGLDKLASGATAIDKILDDLAGPLATYVERLPTRSVRGLTVDQILADKLSVEQFANNVRRQVAAFKPQTIDASKGIDWLLGEIRRMTRHELRKVGLG